MDKRRQERINAEIKKVIAEALRDMKDPNVSSLTSVTDVSVTSDLSFCDVKFSVLGNTKEKNKIIETLKNAEGYFKTKIAKSISIRQVPELRIALDDSIEYADHINSILKTLNIKHNDDNPLDEIEDYSDGVKYQNDDEFGRD